MPDGYQGAVGGRVTPDEGTAWLVVFVQRWVCVCGVEEQGAFEVSMTTPECQEA